MAIRKSVAPVAPVAPVTKAIAKPVAKPVAPVVKKEVVHRTTENIRAMDFVPVWQKSESAEQCNEHFGRDGIWASAFASRLRKMGVNLKKMARGHGSSGPRLNIDELNALL